MLAGAIGRPIYWAGSQKAVSYELTPTPDGRISIRYLPRGTAIGSAGLFLTVATYPVAGALAATRQAAGQSGAVEIHVDGGGVAFYHASRPTNVYLAYPGSGYQIEVFDPSAARAHRLVAHGLIRPVTPSGRAIGAPTAAAVTSTPGGLARLSSELGRPIYWAGAAPGSTYELTRTLDGSIYVRYLPADARVGSDEPYLTVATYPMPNAYQTTQEAAAQPGAVTIEVPGAIGFYLAARPTSVYLAFPGVDEQVEVFDPSAELIRRLIANGQIAPVP
jgi:hypothetical protein